MPLEVLIAVLLAAALHATWNILASGDKRHGTLTVATGSAVVGLAVALWLPVPAVESWPHMAASTALHLAYFSLVTAAYRAGALSVGYPLMRGGAPLISMLGAFAFVGEALGSKVWGVVVLSAGILVLAVESLRRGVASWRGLACAGANAVVIATYAVVDGLGARASGHAVSYAMWLSFFTGLPLITIALVRDRVGVIEHFRLRWGRALVGGTLLLGSYAVVLWAMTRAPIALVAALRETSVIFALILAATILKERFGPVRIAATLAVMLGAALIHAA